MNEKIEFRRKQRTAAGRPTSAAWLAVVAVIVLAIIVSARLSRSTPQPDTGKRTAVAAQSSNESITYSRQNAIVTAVEEVGPAVVSIGVVTTRVVRGVSPMHDDFFEYFFRDFLPPTYYRYRKATPNIGSGVVVSPDGYVVTNQHVVAGAEEITVVTPDGRTFPGTLAGVHDASDIAVIKIDASDLPYARLGNSDDLMVGEWAIAIGNPFGNLLEDSQPSVTVGVISAWKRSFKPGSEGRVYTDMIQTDAAINPGNSGGPLINADGEVIGVNTFIFTRGGGSLGIGFAIPVNRVKKILEEAREFGRVRDVWLGFTAITVEAEAARALGLPSGGAVVRSVEIDSPADQAGLKPGDVIIRVNGRMVGDAEDAFGAFGSVLVGEEFSIDVLRKDKELRLTLVAQESR